MEHLQKKYTKIRKLIRKQDLHPNTKKQRNKSIAMQKLRNREKRQTYCHARHATNTEKHDKPIAMQDLLNK